MTHIIYYIIFLCICIIRPAMWTFIYVCPSFYGVCVVKILCLWSSLWYASSTSSQQRGGGPEGSPRLHRRRKHQPKLLRPHGWVYPGETEGERNLGEHRAHAHTRQKRLCLANFLLSPLHTLRVAVAAAREAWRFPGTCRSSWRRVTAPGRGPRTTFVQSMTRAFPPNGPRLQVPVALMSSAQTASRTPSTPSSTPPASLTVRQLLCTD